MSSSEKLKHITKIRNVIMQKINADDYIKRTMYYLTSTPLENIGFDLNEKLINQPDISTLDFIKKEKRISCTYNKKLLEESKVSVVVRRFKSDLSCEENNISKIRIDIFVPSDNSILDEDQDRESLIATKICDLLDTKEIQSLGKIEVTDSIDDFLIDENFNELSLIVSIFNSYEIVVNESFPNIRELYIIGSKEKSIATPLGNCHFVLVKDYAKFIMLSPYLIKEKQDIINDYGVMLMEEKDKGTPQFTQENVMKEILECNKLSLLELIRDDRRTGFRIVYNELFKLCFKEKNVFDRIITDEEFETYRELIREMNCVIFEKESPNPEIRKFQNYKKLYDKRQGGGGISFESIVSSVEKETGMDTNEMTIYKLNSIFNRIGQFENFHTTILFKTVSPDVEINQWYEDVKKSKHNYVDAATQKQIEDFQNSGVSKESYKSISQSIKK